MIRYSGINYSTYEIENIQKEQDLDNTHQYVVAQSIFKQHLPFLCSLIGDNSVLLDVGCRMCDLYLTTVNEGISNIKYFGLEMSKQMVNAAREKYGSGCIVIWGDVCDSPIGNEFCDVVFMRQTMQFLRSIPLAVKEIYRMLKPGGLVYIVQSIPYVLEGRHYNSVDTVEDVITVFNPYFKMKAVEGITEFTESVLLGVKSDEIF